MNRNKLRRIFCFIACFACAGNAVHSQVSSGGVVAAPSSVVDFTNAGQTIPARKLAADPSTCTLGEQYFNTTSNILKVCTATNTWTAPGGGSVSSVGLTTSNNVFTISGSPVTSSGTLTLTPSGTSGGIPYFSGANALASSAALAVNSVVVGGGAGVAPKTTSVTIDSSGDITTPETITSGSGASAHGKLALGALPSNGATTVGWEAQDLIANSLSLVFPNATPAANSLMLFPAPTSGQSLWSWTSLPGCLDSGGNHLNFNSGTGAISCGTTSSGSAQATIIVANATTTGTTINTLIKLTGTPSTAVISSAGDTGGAIGITTAGAGTTGSATVSYMGAAACIFDGATVAGDYVQISATAAGGCHDSGSQSYPTSGQVIGRVLSTNGAGGAYNLDLFPAEIRTPTLSAAAGVTVTPSGGGITIGADTTVVATQKQVQQGAPICASDTGAADAYVVTLTPVPSSLTRYLTVCFKASAANATTTPTINLNGLGAKTIVSESGAAVAAGVIQASGYYWLQYDDSSAKFFMISNPSKMPGAGIVVATNAQTGAGYTVASSDWGKLLTHSNAAAQVLTLPQAGASFPNGWYVDVENTGAGAWTITPATSTIDGAATLALSTNQGVRVFSNGTNYFTERGIGGAAGSLSLSVNGTSVASEPGLNFISGTGVVQTCVNNSGNNRVDCTPSLNTAVALTNANAQADKPWFCNSTNGTTSYTCSLSASAALTSYTSGMWLMLVADTTNTSSQPSLNVDTVGVKSITQSDGATVPTAGQIVAGRPYWMYYDGSVFRLPSYSGVGSCNGTTYLRGDGACATTNAQAVGTALASAATIAPTSPMHHVTGTTQITTLTAPANFAVSGMGGCVVLIPDGAWTTATTGNIALASTATVSRAMTMCYDNGTSKWYPSY
jgi:hypothetical protein